MKKDMRLFFWQAYLVMIPTFVYTLASDNFHAIVVILTLLTLSGVVKKPLKFTVRNCVWLSVFFLLILTIFSQTVKLEQRFYMMPLPVFPGFAYAAVCLTFMRQRPYQVTLQAAMALGAFMAAGDVIDALDSFQGIVFAAYIDLVGHKVSTFKVIYCVSILFVSPAMLHLFRVSRSGSFKGGRRHLALLIYSFSLLSVFAMAVPAKRILKPAVIYVTQSVNYLGYRMSRGRKGQSSFAEDRVDLNRELPLSVRNGRGEILVWFSGLDSAPGYTRLNIYDSYDNGVWEREKQEKRLPSASISYESRQDHPVSMNFFRLSSVPQEYENAEKATVLYESSFRVKQLLHTAGSFRLAIDTAPLTASIGGGIGFGEKAEVRSSYDLYIKKERSEMAWQDGFTNANYLQLPGDESAVKILKEKADTILGNNFTVKEATSRLASYFSENYTYQFGGLPLNKELDPVIDFLQNKKQGHCQYFANASVLLLRSKGIPARYVEGLVIKEKSRGMDKTYLGRVRDLHAWAEAYDQVNQRWVLVESTPASAQPQHIDKEGFLSALWNTVKVKMRLFLSAFSRGYIGEAIIDFFIDIWGGVLWLYADPWRATLTTVFLLVLLRFFYILWQKRRRPFEGHPLSYLQNEFYIFLKSIEKNTKVSYEAHMTLQEYKSRLKDKSDHPSLEVYFEAIDLYQRLRYMPEKVSDEKVTELRALMKF